MPEQKWTMRGQYMDKLQLRLSLSLRLHGTRRGR